MSVAPPLSVVIPTRDTRALTLACLAALRRAQPEGTEVIVVDDGSRDNTAAAIRAAAPDVRVLARPDAGGFTVAANAGLAAARAPLVVLLNSDAEVLPGALAALAGAFALDPRLGAAGAALRDPDGRPQWSGGPEPTLLWLFALASGLARSAARLPGWRRMRSVRGVRAAPPAWLPATALALRTAAVAAVGGFDPRFRLYGQDADLCLRLRDAGWRVALVPGAHVMHHGGATIARRAGAVAGQDPALLWGDLVRLVAKRRGAAAARRAAAALTLGADLRIGLRRLAALLVVRARRPAWAATTTALAAARRTLRDDVRSYAGRDGSDARQ